MCTRALQYCLFILTVPSNLSPSTQLTNRTKFVKKKKIINHYDDYIPPLKNESKVRILLEIFVPLTSLTCPPDACSSKVWFSEEPILISNQDSSIYCNALGFISSQMFLGHKHTISDETLTIFLLSSAPLTFLSGV